MARFNILSLLAISACTTSVSCTFFETINSSNTLGDHFGYPPLGNATYDYVVIGGGTAGLVIGARLADEGNTVAIIEAGSLSELDNGNLSSVPGTAAYFIGTAPLFKNPRIDWEYQTESDSGLGGRSILYNSGKTLGGGSVRNYMIYDRGSNGTYQKWADEVGDSSYTFPNFLPFFQKSVHLDYPNNAVRPANASIFPNSSAYGTTGPLKVSFSNWANTFGSWAKLALAELGLKELPDFVSGNLFGYQYTSQTIDGTSQTRSSAETSYLRWAMSSNSQLQVFKSTLAKQILFDSKKVATGVLVDMDGIQFSILANKEVILSAGVHRSPQLLMVSGIGPEATLQGLGIPALSNLAGVGQNMWDQPYFGPSYPVSITTHSSIAAPAFLAEQLDSYHKSRTGYLTNPGSDFLAWENLPEDLIKTLSNKTQNDLATQFPSDWPWLQHTFADAYYGTGYDMLIGAPTDGRQYVSVLPTIVATFSRGNVTIKSNNTNDNPVISPNLLSDPRDQEIAVAAFKRARQIFATKSLQKIVTGPEAYPGLNITSDADILKYIMLTASPIWHASSTCKMGKSNDDMAVVDSQARVFGVTGLRVVDASVFPFQVPGHPQATVYALAEKIACDILNKTA